jgi:hypothetical protein
MNGINSINDLANFIIYVGNINFFILKGRV